MKKRILALILAVLMAVPFAVLASAAEAVPAEPKVTATKKVYMCGTKPQGTGDGSSAANGAKCTGWDPANTTGIHSLFMDGAVCIFETKGYMGGSGTVKANAPILFTSLDPADNVSNIAKTPEGEYDTSDTVPGQYGMFMIDNGGKLTIQSAIVFDDTVILNRRVGVPTFFVDNGGALVISNDTEIIVQNKEDHKTPVLEVAEGGYAYLHNIGFSEYKGAGTIVLDRALVTSGKVTSDTFKGFEGKIVAQDGSDPFKAPEKPPVQTGDMTWVVAALAVIATMGTAVTVYKKKAN